MLSRLNSFFDYSVRAGSLFGIPIRLHITLIFFLLPALRGRSWSIWHSLEWIALVVASILLHELGHALTAKHFRLSGLSIMLHGFGGFAVSSGSRTPTQSLLISLAGPAVTFAIGISCYGLGHFGLGLATPDTESFTQFFMLKALGSLNLLLGVLNLLPSLPFDGGQSLVAILNRKHSEVKAMRYVGHLGLIVCVLVGTYGLLTDNSFVLVFALMGLLASYSALHQSGGIRFKEFSDDRRHRLELEAAKKHQEMKTQAYLSDVHSRENERKQQERLRRILEGSDESADK